jgi:hypothetical protein
MADLADLYALFPAPAAPAAAPAKTAAGLAAGTQVMTLDGLIPVEYLSPGDRIITRSGMRRLKRLEVVEATATRPCHIAAAALGHDRPEAEVTLGAATKVHLRDWRAKALYGSATALVAAERLADGEYIRVEEQPRQLRMFSLVFDTAEVFYAEGLEVASA